MEYKFNGEIFSEGQRAFIKIPFNVWEECGQKGNIPVKVIINDFNFECKLVPKGKGIYLIPITKSILNEINSNNELEISFILIPGLTRINKDSPYSLENPIRKIDNIKFIAQLKKGLCGQTSVVMLTGASLEEIINLMGSKCSLSKVIEALDYYGIAHSNKMIYNLKEEVNLPKCCIINTVGHLTVFYDGKLYDSSKGILESLDFNKITGYLEILTD